MKYSLYFRSFILMICLVSYGKVIAQLSKAYPYDSGIEYDTNVYFVEKFDDGLENILSRYSTVVNGDGMSLETDCPDGLNGGKSLKVHSIQGVNSGGYLYKHFQEGFDNEIYVRYYVKYPATSVNFFHHEGVWIGGYIPPLDWPYPRAGICGLGDTRFSIAYEIMDSNWIHPFTHIAPYIYWGEMRSFPDEACWGNFMQCGNYNPPPVTLLDEWTCVEIMIKLNDPVTEKNGELKTWINGVETGHWGNGFPNGSWVWGNFFIDPGQEAFEGFQWRTQAEQLFNYIWIQFYHDDPEAPSSYIMYDNLVVASKYIGPVHVPSAVVEQNTSSSVKIYPNPADHFIFTQGLEPGTEFFILDHAQYIVFSGQTEQENQKILIPELPPGIYFFHTKNKSGSIFQKLILM